MIIAVKKVKNACQIRFLAKFAHISKKSTIFYRLFFGEVCPENSCKIGQFLHEFVSENPPKFDFFSETYQKPWLFHNFPEFSQPLEFLF